MARRASAFDKILQSPAGSKIVFLAGPNEFLPSDPGEAKPSPEALSAMAKAYAKLGYAAGLVSPDEAKAIAAAHATLPASFKVAGDEPQTAMTEAGGTKLGLVFFPAKPGESAYRAIEHAAESLRGQAKLVIGISPWGSDAERVYLERGKPGVDILLGGGPGIGLTARPDSTGKVLWMRSFGKGKTLDTLDIAVWPGKPDFKWMDKGNYSFQIISLGDDFASKPEIEALFAALPGGEKEVKAN